MTRSQILGFILVLIICGVAGWASGAPPEHVNPEFSDWFRSLKNDQGFYCCSVSDGRPVEYRIVSDHYEALIGAQFPSGPDPAVWVPVPADKVLHRADNPTGRAIAFWRASTGILCFVLPPQA